MIMCVLTDGKGPSKIANRLRNAEPWHLKDRNALKCQKRLTLLCQVANFEGSDKYNLLVIGKSAEPRCFKNRLTLATEYNHNQKAWMTSGLFRESECIEKFDQRMAGCIVALLLDNCLAHPKEIKG
jgi:hypothetical protein